MNPCPSCGHCPTCGRGGYQAQWPQYPWQPRFIWYADPRGTWVGNTGTPPQTITVRDNTMTNCIGIGVTV